MVRASAWKGVIWSWYLRSRSIIGSERAIWSYPQVSRNAHLRLDFYGKFSKFTSYMDPLGGKCPDLGCPLVVIGFGWMWSVERVLGGSSQLVSS